MGTRHHIIVTDPEGVVKVRQYAQWDGYFSGKGQEMLELISAPGFLDQLEAKLPIVKLLQKDDPKHPCSVPVWDSIEAKGWIDRWASRDLSWKILRNIVETYDTEILLVDCDGPWEEYSYHINYQDRTWTATKHQYPESWALIYPLAQLPTIEQFLEATAQWRTEGE